jgi:cytoskeletal protein CcmA (bactofilin family)
MDNLKNGDTGGKKTLVEEGTQFKGSLSSSCPIVVRGKIEGDVTAPSLQVSATGAVHGKVKVGEIQSQGELAGEVDADIVQLSGTVKDKTVVRAKSLEVKLTPATGKMQVVFGECTLDIGDMPSKEAAVSSMKDERPAANGKSVPPPPGFVEAADASELASKAKGSSPPKRI